MNKKKAGIIFTYISQGINIISGLIYTPIMLNILGQSEYGLYTLVNSIIANLALLNFGFTGSYLRFYNKVKLDKDNKKLNEFNGMFMMIFLLMSAISILCGIIIFSKTDIFFGDSLDIQEYKKIKILLIIMVLNIAMSFPCSVFDCNIMANEEFLFLKIVNLIQSVLNPFLTLPILLLGYGSIGMVIVSTALAFFKLTLFSFYCIKKLNMRFIFNKFDFYLLKDLFKFTFFIFLFQVVNTVNWQLDKILLGSLCGTISTAIYTVGSTINIYYQQFSAAIGTVFSPLVNEVAVKQSQTKEEELKVNSILSDIFIKVGRIQCIILMLILTGFILWGQEFIMLWVGNEYNNSYIVAILLMISGTVSYIQTMGIEIQKAKNKHQARAIVYLIISLLNIIISIPLIKIYGEIGAAIGTVFALIIGDILFMNYYYQKKIGLNIKLFWKEMIGMVLTVIPCMIIGWIIKCIIVINGVISLIMSIVVYTLLYSIIIYIFAMNVFEKNIVKGLIGKILKRNLISESI